MNPLDTVLDHITKLVIYMYFLPYLMCAKVTETDYVSDYFKQGLGID